MTASISLGVAGALGPDAIARIATAAEDAGFASLWVNDTQEGDSLAALAAAARTTGSLVLATGVIPVDRRPADEIARAVRDLPAERIVLGIGSGAVRPGAVDLVRDAIGRLREQTAARILVGALGPRMRALAATDADGPLLSWLTPAIAAEHAAEAHALAPATRAALYVRTALEDAAAGRLADEAAMYAANPGYAANFARLGIRPEDAVLDAASFDERFPAYRAAVDELVLRAITPNGDLDETLRFAEAAGRAVARLAD